MEQTIVVGGGAAGFFAAIHRAANFPGERVIILERGKAVLEKVRVSGGGRCNVTHACLDPRELVKHYPRGSKELLGPFNRFACGDTMAWFEDRGVPLKIEADGRVFPTSDESASIIDCLWNTAKRRGVQVMTRCRVEGLQPPSSTNSGKWLVQTNAQNYPADRVVIASGSNASVWRWLGEIGLSMVAPVPSLFAFNVPEGKLRALAGISVPWASVKIESSTLAAEGPLLITHRGLSGPAILRLSAWGARELAPTQYQFTIRVNWLARRESDVQSTLVELAAETPKQQMGSRGQLGLPQRLWQFLLEASDVPATTQWAQLGKRQRNQLAKVLTDHTLPVHGKATNKEEFVTAGGVNLREIDFKTFQAKRFPGLFLAGEVLDIDAITGGFNFQAAWTGGYLIGQA